MSELGDRIRALMAPEVPSPEPVRTWWGAVAPGWSEDLRRVLDIPRRPPPVPDVEAVSARYRRPGGTMTLNVLQAAGLLEAENAQGLFAPISVGGGKTILSLLLPTALDARVTVLLVPPELRAKLLDLEYPHLSTQWRLPNLAGGSTFFPDTKGFLHVVSYSKLSSAKGAAVLEEIGPDLIVCDEAHCLKAFSAARTKRFVRYFKARPDARLCALSGTMTSRSIKDFAHLARLALGERAPVPFHYPTLEEWATVLDAPRGDGMVAPPGELTRFCQGIESPREGYRRRLIETPGVVASNADELGVGLEILERKVTLPVTVRTALNDMRESWCTPGGEEITDALTFSRFARQVAAGLYYRWIWPRGEPEPVRREWLEARAEWHREVRRYLTYSAGPGRDSPLLLARAAASGAWRSDTWHRWSDVKDQARPESEAVWIDDFLARDAATWGESTKGIVWYEHDALGRMVAGLGNFRFYGGGDEASGSIILERGNQTIVASVRAHGTGKNLQAFSEQLITTPSSSGKTWEQLLGRTHRTGQQADTVYAWAYQHTLEMKDALKSAVRDAQYIAETLGAPQKLLQATWGFDHG